MFLIVVIILPSSFCIAEEIHGMDHSRSSNRLGYFNGRGELSAAVGPSVGTDASVAGEILFHQFVAQGESRRRFGHVDCRRIRVENRTSRQRRSHQLLGRRQRRRIQGRKS